MKSAKLGSPTVRKAAELTSRRYCNVHDECMSGLADMSTSESRRIFRSLAPATAESKADVSHSAARICPIGDPPMRLGLPLLG